MTNDQPVTNRYLENVVAERLAATGLVGQIEIRPTVPFAVRARSGERARFAVRFYGPGATELVVDEAEILRGTSQAPVAAALAGRLRREIRDAAAA